MKACSYCNTAYGKADTKCPSCGAVQHVIICDNCNTTHQASFCPSCGFGANEKLAYCQKCGVKTRGAVCPDCAAREKEDAAAAAALEREKQLVAAGEQEYIRNQALLAKSGRVLSGVGCKISGHNWLGCKCRRCGESRDEEHTFYPLAVGGDVERCTICGKTRSIKKEEAKAKGKTTAWTIALLILFPPAGILMAWLVQKDWTQTQKIIASVGSGCWLVFAFISNML